MNSSSIKKVSCTLLFFYLLIGFEFIYMATPFAAYFYSVYRPGLQFLDNYPLISWATGFFLPHLAEDTNSFLINILRPAGAVLASIGFSIFLISALQVYYFKLFRKGIVKGGFYKYLLHPQYSAFVLCSFGLLLLWPRYLAVIMFVTLLFVYYFLAKAEEKECAHKFGKAYEDYKNSRRMFLPLNFSPKIFNGIKNNLPLKIAAASALYISLIFISVKTADVIKSISSKSLYSLSSDKEIFLSIFKKEKNEIGEIVKIMNSGGLLDSIRENSGGKRFINYILPSGMYMSEIPMRKPENASNHIFRKNYSDREIKVIVTEAIFKTGKTNNNNILINTQYLKPLCEIWIEPGKGKITRILGLSEKQIRYKNIPEPVF